MIKYEQLIGNTKDIMKKQNITQKELAERAGITEVSVSRYMNCSRVMKVTTITKIAYALNVSVADLFKEGLNGNNV